MTTGLASHMEQVARSFWGDPNPRLSNTSELRWGAQGSRSVDLAKGTWFDHELETGGGVVDLVKREAGVVNGGMSKYLAEQFGIEELNPEPPVSRHISATYDYADENGEVLFQVVRFEPKDFRQRRPDGSWSVKGLRAIPYRLADLVQLEGGTVFVVEGEKDADALWKLGIPATCNAGGAGKWSDEHSACLTGFDVVVLPDNDEAGRRHANIVAASLRGKAASVRLLDLPGLPPKGDVSDWLPTGSAEALYALVETKARIWTPAPPESRFGAIQWADLDHVAVRQDWLIEGIMFCGDAGLLFGASTSGKSFLALDAALAIARGVPFLGKDTRKGSVLYQAGEGGRGLVKRLRAYREYYGLDGEDLPFVLLPARLDLFATDGDAEAFEQECLAWKATLPEPLALIVIDTFSTASPGANENTSEDMGRMLAAGERIQKATGAALIWVHHKNAAGERERGHSSLKANIDTALEVTRHEDSNERTLKVIKVKDSEDGELLQFELQSVEIGTYDSGKPMTSCVVVPAEAGSQSTGSSGRKPITPAQRKFLRVLEDAISHSGGQLPPQPGAWDMRGVEWMHFLTLYRQVGTWPGQSDDAIRKAVSRDGEALVEAGLVARNSPWVWLTSGGSAYLRAMGPVTLENPSRTRERYG